jgi:DNA-binding GntR family transcriptional regulator
MMVWQHLQVTDDMATPMEIAKKTKIAQPTVRQALDKLMRLKRIERIGQGRSTGYRQLEE